MLALHPGGPWRNLLGCSTVLHLLFAAMMMVITPKIVVEGLVLPQQPAGQHPTRTNLVRAAALSSSADDEPRRRSIGDVVQGLHGGKYEFATSSPSSWLSPEGQRFAEASYGSSSDDVSLQEEEEEEAATEPWPQWFVSLKPSSSSTIPAMAVTTDGNIRKTTITVQNQERTWERWFAKGVVVLQEPETNSTTPQLASNNIVLEPAQGLLAPRGNDQDMASISVTVDTTSIVGDDAPVVVVVVVVATEEETWTFAV